MRKTLGRSLAVRPDGAAAVEFALVFPILFALTYGAIVYSYVYVLRQSLAFAAQEAAEAAVDIDPHQSASSYNTQVAAAAQAAVTSIISWMPSNVRAGVTPTVHYCSGGGGGAGCPTVGDAVVVTINMNMVGTSQLFARFHLPLIGNFPPLPDTMTAQATARV